MPTCRAVIEGSSSPPFSSVDQPPMLSFPPMQATAQGPEAVPLNNFGAPFISRVLVRTSVKIIESNQNLIPIPLLLVHLLKDNSPTMRNTSSDHLTIVGLLSSIRIAMSHSYCYTNSCLEREPYSFVTFTLSNFYTAIVHA